MLQTVFEERLHGLRRQWAFWKEQEQLSVECETDLSPIMIYNALKLVEKTGNAIKAELKELQPFKTIGQLLSEDSEEPMSLDELELLIVDMILALRDSLSITNNITPTQAREVAIIVPEQYPNLSLEEIAMCFHKGKIGEYGEIMHRLDANVLLGWLNKFSKEMTSVAIVVNSEKHIQLKQAEMESSKSDLDLLKYFKVIPHAKDANKDLYRQKQLDKKAERHFGGF